MGLSSSCRRGPQRQYCEFLDIAARAHREELLVDRRRYLSEEVGVNG